MEQIFKQERISGPKHTPTIHKKISLPKEKQDDGSIGRLMGI